MPLKFVFQDEIRRVASTPAHYMALLQTVKQLFGDNLPRKFGLQYEDCEGDLIVLASDQDFETMVATELTESDKCIRIIVSEAAEDSISIIAKENIDSGSEKEHEEEAELVSKISSQTAKRHSMEKMKEEIQQYEEPTGPQLKEIEIKKNRFPIEEKKETISKKDPARKLTLEERRARCQERIKARKAAKRNEIKSIAKEALMEDLPKLAQLVKELLENPNYQSNLESELKPSLEEKISKKEIQKSIHHGVTCDMCGMTPIVGIRYKCTVTKNYDLCETCEDKGTHPYPMLKIRTEAQNPYKVVTVIDEEELKKTCKNEKSQEIKPKAEGVPNLEKKVLKPVKKPAPKKKAPSKKDKFVGKVIESLPKKEITFDFLKAAELKQIPEIITEQDYIVYKTVTLMNTGEVAWPKNTFIKCLDSEAGELATLTEVLPGKQINTVLITKSPEKVGSYVYNWQLGFKDAEGKEKLFGNPFKIEFEVVDQKKALEEMKKKAEIEIEAKYTSEILESAKALKDIFSDKDFETICEYVAKSPQKTLEEMIEEYLHSN